MRNVMQHVLVLVAGWALPAALLAQPGPTIKIGQNTCAATLASVCRIPSRPSRQTGRPRT